MASLCRSCRRVFGILRGQKRYHPLRVQQLPSFTRLLTVDSGEPIPPPPLDGGSVKRYPDNVKRIVDDITKLSLIEVAELNELLKTTLNIPDAPMMSVGMAPPSASSGSAQEGKTEEAVEEPSAFTVKLTKFADDSKIKVIKEIKTQVEGMNLVQAKKFVESVPQVVKKDVSKEEAEKIKAALEAAGGVVELE